MKDAKSEGENRPAPPNQKTGAKTGKVSAKAAGKSAKTTHEQLARPLSSQVTKQPPVNKLAKPAQPEINDEYFSQNPATV